MKVKLITNEISKNKVQYLIDEDVKSRFVTVERITPCESVPTPTWSVKCSWWGEYWHDVDQYLGSAKKLAISLLADEVEPKDIRDKK